jgi:hypothetical protein
MDIPETPWTYDLRKHRIDAFGMTDDATLLCMLSAKLEVETLGPKIRQ